MLLAFYIYIMDIAFWYRMVVFLCKCYMYRVPLHVLLLFEGLFYHVSDQYEIKTAI